MLFNFRDWWWFSSWFRWSSCILHFKWSVSPWFWDWLVCISALFWWLNYVFILFNHLFDTIAWNRFGFYTFPFSSPWFWNWLVSISELFWWLNYVFMLVNHQINATAWPLSLLLKKQFNYCFLVSFFRSLLFISILQSYFFKPFYSMPILYGFVFKPFLGRVTISLFISICIYYSYISLSLFEHTSLSLASL